MRQRDKQEIVFKEVFSPKEAAQFLGIHVVTFYRLKKKGKVPAKKVGGQWRVMRNDLEGFLRGERL